jgi:hypothetical protein
MEGRITTPPTTSGVKKRAGQSKAEGISKPNIASCQSCAPAKQSTENVPSQCLLGKPNRQARALGNLDANRQEGMIRADFITAFSWDWPIIPGKIMQGRPGGGGSCRNGLLHSRPLPRRYEPKTMYRRFLPCSIAQVAVNTTTCQIVSQTKGGGSTSHRCYC